MASSGGGGGTTGPPAWRNSGGLGTSAGSDGSGESERVHSLLQSPNPTSHNHGHHRERERDRDNNHETVCNLLSMLTIGVDHNQQQQPQFGIEGNGMHGTTATVDNQRMLLVNMATTPESCLALRRAGCIPLLIELLHPPQSSSEGVHHQPPEIIRVRAAKALKNIVQFNPDEKMKRKELRVLKLLEGIRLFSDAVKALLKVHKHASLEGNQKAIQEATMENVQHPTSNITTLMKLSFDEEHRNTMCLLGAIHALADLIVSDHLIHGNDAPDLKEDCLLLRRYSGMTLTNLTFGDGTNKALLCGMKEFLSCLVAQLDCENEDICQVTASVLRNLSWHADGTSRASLRDSDAVPKLTVAAIKSKKESTLKATLSALWNLSAHSAANKSGICLASQNALAFLISLLRPNNPVMKQMKTPMTIIENAGGILRNISSQISGSSELRKVLRENHCYEILLEHLKSSSLTVVSNACGTLWNLSGGTDCEEDQRKLLDLNAVPMLKSLVYSKHERISQGASAALRNLLSSRFAKDHTLHLDSRLTAQIYSPSPGDRGPYLSEHNLKSPGSDNEFDMEFNVAHQHNHHHQHPQLLQQEPPAAHQQSSAAAASFFHRSGLNSSHNKPLPLHFHNHPPFPQSSGFRHRPSTINYSAEAEPLDLTMTSAKSSPIHVISAAEFGGISNHTMQHHHRHGGGSNVSGGFYRPQSQNQSHTFLNAPNIIHQAETSNGNSGSLRKYSFPGAKFNQSCPEILSRFQQNSIPAHQNAPESKPLDYSSTSASASSSTRGAGEAAGIGISNDSNGGGDTTFNYSLRFTEVETEEDAANSHANNGSASKSEDTVKTYCYEGTPHNFSISNSCQDLVQELEYEKEAAAAAEGVKSSENQNSNNKLQSIDEIPKAYYVENTPAVFSRTSSLSSINSSGGLNAGENVAEYGEGHGHVVHNSSPKKSSTREQCPHIIPQPIPMPRKKPITNSLQPNSHTPRVTFSAEETPLMFSRCSSVASLDSLDVGVNGSGAGTAQKNDDDLSDYSRRASEVVSPSDLPDSPRALAPPIRIYEQKKSLDDNAENRQTRRQENEDTIKIFSMEERSGLNSCRSLSPLTVDGEELPVIGKGKLDSNARISVATREVITVDNKTIVATESSRIQDQVSENCSTQREMISQETKEVVKGPIPKPRVFPDDELKYFAIEGTPFYGVSNATSLSDLTMDIDEKDLVSDINPNSLKDVIVNGHITTELNSNLNIKRPDSHSPVTLKETSTIKVDDDPIYSDAQLLEKCIRVGKAMGIPKSQSEFKIGGDSSNRLLKKPDSTSNGNLMTVSLQETDRKHDNHDSQSEDFDDADLAALIMIGRNRTKDKDRICFKPKSSRKNEKESKVNKPTSTVIKSEQPSSASDQKSENMSSDKSAVNPSLSRENSSDSGKANEKVALEIQPETNSVQPQTYLEPKSPLSPVPQPRGIQNSFDPNQISTTSLGSEWYDETPTFSSPIPSMSISTAFRLAGSVGGDSSCSKPLVPAKLRENNDKKEQQIVNNNMNASSISVSLQHELLEDIDPPSTFSNLVSSVDCVLPQSPLLNPKSQNSTLSDRLNKKWKALADPLNANSTYSNLSGQKPPPDFDLENSMISVASIRSEIYEFSSTSNNDIFESALEEFGGSGVTARPSGDTSLGGNTYTIFPPENVLQTGAKSTDLSEGANTIVSEDFTDAEDIEDFETAPVDDLIEDFNTKPEKSDLEKDILTEAAKQNEVVDNVSDQKDAVDVIQTDNDANECNFPTLSAGQQFGQLSQKPLMEVHPLDTSNKYNTFVVRKSSMSPRASPRQKRREDPERYRTRTINSINTPKSLSGCSDANGNPDLKFATYRVGGPKVLKAATNLNNRDTDSSNSPASTPGSSPKGIRGRRKPLYSSLPPSAIVRKRTAPPPVPPKPTRGGSPARSTTSSTGGVYVRPTRTTELRIAANNSRDNSPSTEKGYSSKNSSNSSLNLIHQSSRSSDAGGSISTRPKVAPKPPVRTTPAMTSGTSTKGFVGSTASMQIKASNSSFGFGQQAKIGDSGVNVNMKGYNTLPKSSKLGTDSGSLAERLGFSGESRESIPGSEKSSKSGIGKITNLWRKMDFRGNNSKESSLPVPINQPKLSKNGETAHSEKKATSTGSKFSNIFGRKSKDKSTPKPFREPPPNHQDSTVPPFSYDSTSCTTGGVWVRRDGDNKVIVPPFNYTPPGGLKNGGSAEKTGHTGFITTAIVGPTPSADPSVSSTASSAAVGSAKITTV